MTTTELAGVIVPTTTPFDAHGDITFSAIAEQVDWLFDVIDCCFLDFSLTGTPRKLRAINRITVNFRVVFNYHPNFLESTSFAL
jgi:hypothetical protein